jgi:D-cysteine desulfhydrase
MGVDFPPRIKLAQTPTPLTLMSRLSEQLGGPRIWLKRDDKTGSDVSGNKIRKLEFCLAKAMNDGCDTVITIGGIQSNHCRATALLCAELGLKCHLILRGNAEERAAAPDGNLLLDYLAGAEISFYSHAEFQRCGDDIIAQWEQHYRDQKRKAYTIPIGASDGVGLWGYIKACEELSEDFKAHNISPGYIVCAMGSGGTLGGLIAGNALYQLNSTVVGINVCDDKAYFINKVKQDLKQWQEWYSQTLDVESLAINIIDGYVGEGYAKASPVIFETIKNIASMEGVVFDPVYTGKAFYGLLDQIKQGYFDHCKDVVFIHTGGIFGLFAQRDQIVF